MSRSHLYTPEFPAGPPPEVLAEVEAAWERAQEPSFESLELHFERAAVPRRAWGELRLPDGTRVARLTAAEALRLACGDARL
jgi:hypothetical protein